MRSDQVLYPQYLCLFLIFSVFEPVFPQESKDFINTTFLKKLNRDTSYLELKKKIVSEFANTVPGRWGQFVDGVSQKVNTRYKYIAFTFDACGGKNGNGYDKELIDFLHLEKIPATLFVTGKWIDANFITFLNLSHDTLFEIENHGLNHKPCSIDGKSIYGIHGTSGVEEVFDEIEANALKIKTITKYNPRFYRPAAAFIDEASVRIAEELGIKVVSFNVLSGDAVAFTPESEIERNILNSIKPGDIVILHFNHPEWNTYEAMQRVVPKLRLMGYHFVRLIDFELISGK